jgi:hypothetical protein
MSVIAGLFCIFTRSLLLHIRSLLTLWPTRIYAARLPGTKRTVASFLGLDDVMDSPDQPEPAPPAKASAPVAVDATGAATGSGPHERNTVHAQEQEDREFQDLVARYTF